MFGLILYVRPSYHYLTAKKRLPISTECHQRSGIQSISELFTFSPCPWRNCPHCVIITCNLDYYYNVHHSLQFPSNVWPENAEQIYNSKIGTQPSTLALQRAACQAHRSIIKTKRIIKRTVTNWSPISSRQRALSVRNKLLPEECTLGLSRSFVFGECLESKLSESFFYGRSSWWKSAFAQVRKVTKERSFHYSFYKWWTIFINVRKSIK